MSENNPIRVFVTHMFEETDDYLRVFEFLESMERFYYLNVSKPDNSPEPPTLEAIKDELIAQIKECEVVMVLATAYMARPDLVKYQMDVADANEKPCIAIRPFGGILESPEELVERAVEHLDWNNREIANALRRQGRMQDTSSWDVIDFPGYTADGPVESKD